MVNIFAAGRIMMKDKTPTMTKLVLKKVSLTFLVQGFSLLFKKPHHCHLVVVEIMSCNSDAVLCLLKKNRTSFKKMNFSCNYSQCNMNLICTPAFIYCNI